MDDFQIFNIAFEILKKSNSPLSVKELHKKIKEKNGAFKESKSYLNKLMWSRFRTGDLDYDVDNYEYKLNKNRKELGVQSIKEETSYNKNKLKKDPIKDSNNNTRVLLSRDYFEESVLDERCNNIISSLGGVKEAFFYFTEKRNFLKIRNCGVKTNEQLCRFFKNYSLNNFTEKKLEIIKEINNSVLSNGSINTILNFPNLEEFIKYYSSNENSVNHQNLDEKSFSEILQYVDKIKLLNEIKVKDLVYSDNLSKRGFNVCQINNLNTLLLIQDYFYQNQTFLGLKNCGIDTNNELIQICKRYEIELKSKRNDSIKLNRDSYNKLKQNKLKVEYLEIKSQLLFNEISKKSKNLIYKLLENDFFTTNEFVSKCILIPLQFENLSSCGKKSCEELNNFRLKISETINKIITDEITQIEILLLKLSIRLGNIVYDGNLKQKLSNKTLDLLYFVENYILRSNCISESQKEIFKYLINTNENNFDSLSSLAKILNLTRERCRQLVTNIIKNGHSDFYYLKELLEYCYPMTEWLNENYNQVNIIITENIKLKYINYNLRSLTNLLSIIDSEKHFVLSDAIKLKGQIGSFDHTKYKKYRTIKIHYWISTSFISKNITLQIFEDYFEKLTSKNNNDYTFKLDKYPLNSIQKDFITKIIAENFETNTDLIINKNTKLTNLEILENILSSSKNPITAKEILEIGAIKYPQIDFNINSIKSTLNNELFISIRGKGQSKYGLKIWEEDDSILGGSITNLCYNYLNGQNDPVHILTLTRFILKYRNTNQKNILSNLRISTKYNFLIYPGGFIGLKSKKYSAQQVNNFRSIIPYDVLSVFYFIKDRYFYNMDTIISKFSAELNLFPIQIEDIINSKINEGGLTLRDRTLFYNYKEEDIFIRKLFEQSAKIKESIKVNPYKIELEESNFACLILLNPTNNFPFEKELNRLIKNNQTDIDFNIIINLDENRMITSLIWKNEKKINDYISQNTKHLNFENLVERKELKKTLVVELHFEEKAKFTKILSKIISSSSTNNLDIIELNIEGLSKLDAYSKIISTYEADYNISINLTDAKKIYNLLNLNLI